MTEAQDDLEKLVGVLRKRRSQVEILTEIAESISMALDENRPITDNQLDAFRKSIEAVKSYRLVGSSET